MDASGRRDTRGHRAGGDAAIRRADGASCGGTDRRGQSVASYERESESPSLAPWTLFCDAVCSSRTCRGTGQASMSPMCSKHSPAFRSHCSTMRAPSAWAEHTSGAAQGADNALFVTLGTGVGGAIAFRGEVLVGGIDAIGEWCMFPSTLEGISSHVEDAGAGDSRVRHGDRESCVAHGRPRSVSSAQEAHVRAQRR